MRYPGEGFNGGSQKLCTYICNKTLNYSIHLKLKLYFFFERTFFCHYSVYQYATYLEFIYLVPWAFK